MRTAQDIIGGYVGSILVLGSATAGMFFLGLMLQSGSISAVVWFIFAILAFIGSALVAWVVGSSLSENR